MSDIEFRDGGIFADEAWLSVNTDSGAVDFDLDRCQRCAEKFNLGTKEYALAHAALFIYRAGLERGAKVCDDSYGPAWTAHAKQCAVAIRALAKP